MKKLLFVMTLTMLLAGVLFAQNPPTNLTYTLADHDVTLAWDAPQNGGGAEGILRYDNGENADGIGTGGAADFDVAIRFEPAALEEYAGSYLSQIEFFPKEANCEYSIKVWTGANAANLVVEQTVSDVTIEDWNLVTLDTPVQIDASQELWFGYRCNTQAGYPAGVDAGPAVAGSGDMIYYQGAWSSIANDFGLDYNWNIAGYVTATTQRKVANTVIRKITNNPSERDFAFKAGHLAPGNNVERTLVGYNIYRNDTLIYTETDSTMTTYVDAGLADGVYNYYVTAVYDENESDPTNTVTVDLEFGTIAGTVTDADGVAIEGATVEATTERYSTTTDANGAYTMDVMVGDYYLTVSAEGFVSQTQPVTVGAGETVTADFTLQAYVEDLNPPRHLEANVVANDVNLTWDAPATGDFEAWSENFEGGAIPDGWQATTNSAQGWYVTMDGSSQFFTIPDHDGYYACSNDDDANDDGSVDYLITPPQDLSGVSEVTLTFDSFFNGSYSQTAAIEVSLDGGTTWDVAFDLTASDAWETVNVDLADYCGNADVLIAFHSNDNGSWASGWAVDNVSMDIPVTRDLTGYKVYKDNQYLADTTDLFYTDADLDAGTYLYTVTAVYTDGESAPVGPVEAVVLGTGVIQGTVTDDISGNPVEGAVITAGEYTATTIADGTYSLDVVEGTYDVTCVAAGYSAATEEGVVITDGDVATVDFSLIEAINPPTNVVATVNNDAVDLTWGQPGSGGGGPADEFTEDFDAGTLPEGWTIVDADGDGNNWENTMENGFGFDAHSGEGAMTSASYINGVGALTPDNWLISPAIVVGNGSTLSYWHDAQDASWSDEYYYLKLSTTGTELGDFTETLWEGVTPADWAEVSIDLSAYAGNTVYLAWEHTNVTDMFYMKIDDVSVSVTTTRAQYTAPLLVTNHNNGYAFKTAGMTKSQIEEREVAYNNANETRDREIIGYAAYRLLEGDEGNEGNWTTLSETITDTMYTDNTWADAASGIYKYAIKAVYTNNNMSDAAFSNVVYKDMTTTVNVNVADEAGTALDGATVTLTNIDGSDEHIYTMVTVGGTAAFTDVWKGEYNLTVSLDGYSDYTQNGIEILEPAEINVVLGESLIPPSNLAGVITGNTAVFTWTAPGGGGNGDEQWIHYDSGDNSDGIGTGGAADFDVAIKYDADQIEDFDNMYVTKIKFFPKEENCEYSVRVWQGADAANLLVDQPVANVTIEDWNEITLDNAVQIDASQELWIGYRCNAQTGYPAGVDAGPAVAGYGDMIYYQGAWSSIATDFGLDYNWNIQGYIANSARGNIASTPLVVNDNREVNGSFAIGNLPASPNATTSDRSLLGYNLYMDGSVVNGSTLIPEATYTQTDIANGNHVWVVTAVYDGGESAPSNVFQSNVDATPNQIPTVTTLSGNYPNPFNPTTTISYSINSNSKVTLDIYNIRGQKIRTLVNENQMANTYNVVWDGKDSAGKTAASGVYFYKLTAGRYVSTKKMILMK